MAKVLKNLQDSIEENSSNEIVGVNPVTRGLYFKPSMSENEKKVAKIKEEQIPIEEREALRMSQDLSGTYAYGDIDNNIGSEEYDGYVNPFNVDKLQDYRAERQSGAEMFGRGSLLILVISLIAYFGIRKLFKK